MRGVRASGVLIVIVAVAFAVFFLARHGKEAPIQSGTIPSTPEPINHVNSGPAATNGSAPTNSLVAQPETSLARPASNRITYSAPAPPPVEATPESKTLPPETVLENMRTTVRNYLSTFGENPIGNNAEITKMLQGENPKQINFIKGDDGNRINSLGELVDVWGTPYFFHQLSAHEMEIRSAGPDHKMWTSDDLVIH